MNHAESEVSENKIKSLRRLLEISEYLYSAGFNYSSPFWTRKERNYEISLSHKLTISTKNFRLDVSSPSLNLDYSSEFTKEQVLETVAFFEEISNYDVVIYGSREFEGLFLGELFYYDGKYHTKIYENALSGTLPLIYFPKNRAKTICVKYFRIRYKEKINCDLPRDFEPLSNFPILKQPSYSLPPEIAVTVPRKQ